MDFLFFLPIFTILVCYIIYGLPLTLILISLDGLFSALYFMKLYLKGDNKRQIVDNSTLYSIHTLNRYAWYVVCGYVYQTLITAAWIDPYNLMMYAFLLVNVPYVMNRYIKNRFEPFFNLLDRKKNEFAKNMIVKQLTKIINNVSHMFIDIEGDVVERENIEYVLNHSDRSLTNAITVAKNTALVFASDKLGKYSPLYQRMFKTVFNYRYPSKKISRMTDERVREIIRKVHTDENWDALLEPSFIQALIHIYYKSELDPDNNILLLIAKKFQYSLLKFFSVWTLVSYTGYPIVGALVFIILHMYEFGIKKESMKKNIRNIEYVGKFLGIVLGASSLLVVSSYAFSCFLCEFSYYILMNPVTLNIYKSLFKNTMKILHENQILKRSQILKITYHTICFLPIYFVIGDHINNLYITLFTSGMSLIVLSIAPRGMRDIGHVIMMINMGATSGYNPIHLLSNIHNYYILTNFVNSEMYDTMVYWIKYKTSFEIKGKDLDLPMFLEFDVADMIDYDIDRHAIELKNQYGNSVILDKKHHPIILESFMKLE